MEPIVRNGVTIELTEIDQNIIQLFEGTNESKLIASKLLLSNQVTPEIIEKYLEASFEYIDLEEKEQLLRSLLKFYLNFEKEVIEKITVE